MTDDCGFNAKDITVASRTLVCRNPNCKAEGLHEHVLVIPLSTGAPNTQGQVLPREVLLLCKDCLNKQRLLYTDYLKMVNLKATL